jgi:hypothetical protein
MMCIFALQNTSDMANDYPIEEPKPTMASEPVAAYGVAEKRKVFSEEELSHGIPLEESRRRLTELIYNHYHQQQ